MNEWMLNQQDYVMVILILNWFELNWTCRVDKHNLFWTWDTHALRYYKFIKAQMYSVHTHSIYLNKMQMQYNKIHILHFTLNLLYFSTNKLFLLLLLLLFHGLLTPPNYIQNTIV